MTRVISVNENIRHKYSTRFLAIKLLENDEDLKKIDEFERKLIMQDETVIPVSYTHLDVYKRQLIGCPVTGFAFFIEYRLFYRYLYDFLMCPGIIPLLC